MECSFPQITIVYMHVICQVLKGFYPTSWPLLPAYVMQGTHAPRVCWPSARRKRVTNHFRKENLHFKAPWCRCCGELCSPTEWPQKHREMQSNKSAISKHQRRESLTLSRVDRSVYGDEPILNVHNQDLQVARLQKSPQAQPKIHWLISVTIIYCLLLLQFLLVQT